MFLSKKNQKKTKKKTEKLFWFTSNIPHSPPPPPLESPGHAPLAIQKDNKRLVTTLKVRVRGEAHDEVHLKCL